MGGQRRNQATTRAAAKLTIGLLAPVVLVVLPLAGIAAGADACPASRCVDTELPVAGGMTVPDNRLRVLLPDGYRTDVCRRWPVLYLLHGVGDTWESWSTRTDLVEFTRQLPVIVVMPDAGKTPDPGWFSDWADGSRQWESFHVGALIPWVDATFRTLGDGHRMVAGFSMGGFGAMSYAARHPGLFSAAASVSGLLDTMYLFPASGVVFENGKSHLGTPDDRVWGDQVEDEKMWREHNPTDLAARLKGTALFIYSGMGSPAGEGGDNPQKPPNYIIENLVYQTNLSFTRALDAAGVSYESDFHPGYHDWPYYQAGLHWALPKMLETLATRIPSHADRCATSTTARLPNESPAPATLPATGDEGSPVAAIVLLGAALTLARLVCAAQHK